MPARLPIALDPDLRRLYDLIWRRTAACQMAAAETLQVAVEAASAKGDLRLRAGGTAVTFPGYLAVYGPPPPAASSGDGSSAEGDGGAAAALGLSGDEADGAGAGGADDDAALAAGGLSAALQALKEGDRVTVEEVGVAVCCCCWEGGGQREKYAMGH